MTNLKSQCVHLIFFYLLTFFKDRKRKQLGRILLAYILLRFYKHCVVVKSQK